MRLRQNSWEQAAISRPAQLWPIRQIIAPKSGCNHLHQSSLTEWCTLCPASPHHRRACSPPLCTPSWDANRKERSPKAELPWAKRPPSHPQDGWGSAVSSQSRAPNPSPYAVNWGLTQNEMNMWLYNQNMYIHITTYIYMLASLCLPGRKARHPVVQSDHLRHGSHTEYCTTRWFLNTSKNKQTINNAEKIVYLDTTHSNTEIKEEFHIQ